MRAKWYKVVCVQRVCSQPGATISCQKCWWMLICQHLFNVKLYQRLPSPVGLEQLSPGSTSFGQMNLHFKSVRIVSHVSFPMELGV